MASTDHGTGTRTLRGMFWAYGSYFAGRVLVLVSIGILARLLSPSQFGIVAFAVIVTTLLETVKDLGLSQALIVAKGDEVYEKASTAWTVGVLLGVGLAGVTALAGPAAAAFFDEPELVVMLPLLGLNFIIRALGITHYALAQKHLDFRTRTTAEMADVVVRGLVGIGLALAGAGAYSIVGGYLAGATATTVTLWMLMEWRPSPRLNRAHLRGLLRFGGAVTALEVISAVIANVDYIIIGRVLGSAKLGLYTLGFRLPELMIINLSVVAGTVLFPAFAGVARSALADAYLSSLRYVLMVCAPLVVTLCVLAEPVVLVAFGPKWTDSASVMQVLTLMALGITIGVPAGIAYKALGRVDVLVKLAIPRALLVIGSVAYFVNDGIVAVAACQAAVAALFSIIGITLAGRLLGTGLRRIAEAAWPPVVAAAVLAAVLMLIDTTIGDAYATLAVALPLGAVTYLGTLWLVAPDTLRKLVTLAFPRTV